MITLTLDNIEAKALKEALTQCCLTEKQVLNKLIQTLKIYNND